MTIHLSANQRHAVFFLLLAVATPALQALVTLNPAMLGNWHDWALGVALACVRQGADAGLTLLAESRLPAANVTPSTDVVTTAHGGGTLVTPPQNVTASTSTGTVTVAPKEPGA